MIRPLEERFWSKVDKRGPDECWLWLASVDSNGYGRLRVEGKNRKANRVSFELANGPIPEGVGRHGNCVCHRCDAPACVNPAHLFLGTNAENIADCIAKGRWTSGERNGRAKLTEADVRAIRVAYASGGTTHQALAREFGVDYGIIGRVVRFESWTHVVTAEPAKVSP